MLRSRELPVSIGDVTKDFRQSFLVNLSLVICRQELVDAICQSRVASYSLTHSSHQSLGLSLSFCFRKVFQEHGMESLVSYGTAVGSLKVNVDGLVYDITLLIDLPQIHALTSLIGCLLILVGGFVKLNVQSRYRLSQRDSTLLGLLNNPLLLFT